MRLPTSLTSLVHLKWSVMLAVIALLPLLLGSKSTAAQATPPPLSPSLLNPGPIPAISLQHPLADKAAKRVALGQDPYAAIDQ